MAVESTNVPPQKASFFAAISSLAVAASATDFFTITGAQGKRVTINRISFSGIATSATAIPLMLIKRSTANTGGTSTPVPGVNADSSMNMQPAASVLAYTANPGALGTAVGNVNAARVILSTASASVGSAPVEFNFERMYHKPVILNNASEVLALNYSGTTAAGNAVDIMIAWTEETV